MTNIIKPDNKLFTKQWLILLSISGLIVLVALLLQTLIPLGGEVSVTEVGKIVWPLALGSIILLWLIFVPALTLWIKNLSYIIEEDRITIRKGVLTKVQKNIPYRAITDFILHRSLYDRLLGIASIRIQTAGQTQSATGYEGNIAGVVDFTELHQNLRARIKSLHPISESLGTREPWGPGSSENILNDILAELKSIRKAMDKN